jgi:hypothetical protein
VTRPGSGRGCRIPADGLLTGALLTDGLLADGLLADGLLADGLLAGGLLAGGLLAGGPDGVLGDGPHQRVPGRQRTLGCGAADVVPGRGRQRPPGPFRGGHSPAELLRLRNRQVR